MSVEEGSNSERQDGRRMTAEQTTHEPSEEDRLMALLALTSQELPERPRTDVDWTGADPDRLSPAQLRALHDQLDADPAAFETFLRRRRERRADPIPSALTASERAPFWRRWLAVFQPPQLRYALALGLVVLGVAFVFTAAIDQPSSLSAALDRGYRDLHGHGPPALDVLSATEEAGRARLGFAPPGAASVEAQAFAAGLESGRRRLVAARDAARATREAGSVYFELGEWHVLLAAASVTDPLLAPAFWREQLAVHRELARSLTDDAATRAHLARIADLLAPLTQSERRARAAHALSSELRLFREQLVAPE
jgi:hypothetical protein